MLYADILVAVATQWASPSEQLKKHMILAHRVVDPDPDPYWIRIQLGLWIRIRIRIRNPDPDPGEKK